MIRHWECLTVWVEKFSWFSFSQGKGFLACWVPGCLALQVFSGKAFHFPLLPSAICEITKTPWLPHLTSFPYRVIGSGLLDILQRLRFPVPLLHQLFSHEVFLLFYFSLFCMLLSMHRSSHQNSCILYFLRSHLFPQFMGGVLNLSALGPLH